MGEERRRALEDRYILDFQRFAQTRARRNRLFANWAAKKLGRNDQEAYLEEVECAGNLEAGDSDVMRKISNDLRNAGQIVDEQELRAMMNDMMFEAAAQLEAETQAEDCS
nr:ATPase inhibitor subunit zeta [Rhizobium mesosinicum]